MEFKNKYIYTQQMFREFVKYCKYRYLHGGIVFLTIMTVFCLAIANKFGVADAKFVICMIGMIVLLALINFLYTLESEIIYKNSLERKRTFRNRGRFYRQNNSKIGENKEYFDYEDITSLYNLKVFVF